MYEVKIICDINMKEKWRKWIWMIEEETNEEISDIMSIFMKEEDIDTMWRRRYD